MNHDDALPPLQVFTEKSPQEMARHQASLKAQIDALEGEAKRLKAEYDKLRNEIFPARMEEAGLEGFRLAGVGTISLSPVVFARMLDKEVGYDWLREEGHGDVIVDYVHPGTLKSLVKELIMAGEAPPEEIISAYIFSQTRITKR